MSTVMALLISLFGIQGSGNPPPADGVGGTGHGNVFDTPPEYCTWLNC